MSKSKPPSPYHSGSAARVSPGMSSFRAQMDELHARLLGMAAELGPPPKLAVKIEMSQQTFDHILADQGEINEDNITPWQRLAGIPVHVTEEVEYGKAKVIYNTGEIEVYPVRVMIRVRV